MTDEEEIKGKAVGGKARADKLSPERKAEIARKGAAARWGDKLPVAICGSPDRPLRIGEAEIQCYVLDDKTRVLTQADFLEAMGRHRKANVRREGGEERTPPILQGKALNRFISKELLEKSRPITFKLPGGVRASGYRAEILPEVCELYLKARDSGDLPINQQHVARQAEILIRGLAHIGIIALVDEATGYQELRAKDALSRILEAFVAKELQPWVHTFPGEYYKHLFRLRGLKYPSESVLKPKYFGHLTNNIVYARLAPGVLEELKRKTPRSASGRHKEQLHRRLTTDLGHPKLREHLASVVTLMKISNSYDQFMAHLENALPKYQETMRLPFDGDEPATGI